MDAPAHFIADGMTADVLPISRFVCPLVVIDISARAARDHDATVNVADIAAWEKAHGRIPAQACVVMRSGWERRLRKPSGFLNQDDNAVMHTPGFSEEAAAFLVSERSIAGVGVDTLSLDVGASTTFKAHQAVLGAGRWGIECLANLGQVPEVGATVFIAPTKVQHSSGGPVRVYAALP
jgi:kynurenine formamidase